VVGSALVRRQGDAQALREFVEDLATAVHAEG